MMGCTRHQNRAITTTGGWCSYRLSARVLSGETDLLLLDLIGFDRSSHGPVEVAPVMEPLPAGATLLLAVTNGWLQHPRFMGLRAELLEMSALRTVVDVGSPAMAKGGGSSSRQLTAHGVPVSLLHLVRGEEHGTTYFVSVPAASNSTAPAVERFLDGLRDQPSSYGARTEWGFTRRVDANRWDASWLRPERQDLLEELADRPGVVDLRDIAMVLPVRRPPRHTDVGPDVTIIQAKDVTRGLPATEELATWPSGGRVDRLTPVHPGDIIGSISGPYGRWAIVPESYRDIYAGDHTVVIQLDPAAAMSPEYLVAWLSSTAAQPLFVSRGTVIQRLDLRELEGMPVPTVEGMVAAAQQIARVDEAISALESRLDDLAAARAGVFDGLRRQEIRRRIAEVADNASTTIASLERHGELLRRVQDLYPYPIARNVRALRLARHPRARYDEILNSFESLLQYLTMLAAGWARTAGVVTDQMSEWGTKIQRGGASLGTWLAAARSIAQAAVEADAIVAFAPALAATGRASLYSALDQLVRERNSVHGNRPQSDDAYEARVEATLPILELALEASAFLVRDDLLWVTDVRPIDRPGGPVFEVTAERAIGDHPDWDLVTFMLPALVFDQRFYVRALEDDRMLDMSPFLCSCFDARSVSSGTCTAQTRSRRRPSS
jgi:hypothetical protein